MNPVYQEPTVGQIPGHRITPGSSFAMPNQLCIPFKKTYAIPIRQAIKAYIQTNHPDTHPDAFKWDVSRWEGLRKDAISNAVHVDNVKIAFRCVSNAPIPAVVSRAIKLSRSAHLHTDKAPQRRRYNCTIQLIIQSHTMNVDWSGYTLQYRLRYHRVATYPTKFVLRTSWRSVQSGRSVLTARRCRRQIDHSRLEAGDGVQSGMIFAVCANSDAIRILLRTRREH